MKRRNFLKVFCKASAAVVAAPALARVPEVIGEGYTVKKGIRTEGSFAKALWPQIKAEWEKTYADEQYFGLAQKRAAEIADSCLQVKTEGFGKKHFDGLTDPEFKGGFGLAQVKAEGSSVIYDVAMPLKNESK